MELTDKFSGLIFDCDGTLTDSMPLHYVAWRDTMSRHGIEFPEDRFYAMGGMPTDKIVAILADEHGLSLDAVKVAAEKDAAFLDNLDDLQPRQNVCDIVRRHYGHLPMAVGSGSDRPTVMAQLQHVGLSDAFVAIVTAEDTPQGKPDPGVFLQAAERLASIQAGVLSTKIRHWVSMLR